VERWHKVIYFDLDGTLVDYEADACFAFSKAAEHAIGRHAHLGDRLTEQMFRDARQATYIQYGDIGIPLADWYRECMRIMLESADLFDIQLADEMGQLYGLFRNTTLSVFEDALEVVPALARSYRLGLLSNGSSRIEKLAIAEHFSYHVFAREVGHEKPAPEIFCAAADAAGCDPSEILFVGDGQHTDIIGARNAGIEIVWINRGREELINGIPQPDHEIHDLREIFNITSVE
jgi:putative hydrolase of the HAD superfamily